MYVCIYTYMYISIYIYIYIYITLSLSLCIYLSIIRALSAGVSLPSNHGDAPGGAGVIL